MTEIKLLTSQLLYDIRNIAYVEGHVLDDDTTANLHTRHLVTDIAEDGNIDIIARALHLAFASLLHLLSGSLVPRPSPLVPLLSLPEAFTLHLVTCHSSLIHHLAHRYMVASALCHWLSITHPGAAPKWRAAATDAETRLRSLTLAPSVTIRRLSPW